MVQEKNAENHEKQEGIIMLPQRERTDLLSTFVTGSSTSKSSSNLYPWIFYKNIRLTINPFDSVSLSAVTGQGSVIVKKWPG